MAKTAVSRKRNAKTGSRENGRRAGMTRQEREILEKFFQDVDMGLLAGQFEVRKGQVYSVSPLLGERKGFPSYETAYILESLKRTDLSPARHLQWRSGRVSMPPQ